MGFFQRFYGNIELLKLERPHEDNNPNKPQLFWDGFQWVDRKISTQTVTFDLNTKPGRRIQITNLPLHLNISTDEVTDFLYAKLIEKDLIDHENKNIIRGVDLNTSNNSGIFVLKSTEDGKRLQLLDGKLYY